MKILFKLFIAIIMTTSLVYANDNKDCSKRRAVSSEDLTVISPSYLLSGLINACKQNDNNGFYKLLTKNIQDIHTKETGSDSVSPTYLQEICPTFLQINKELENNINNATYEVKEKRKLPANICAESSNLNIYSQNKTFLMKMSVSLENGEMKLSEL